MKARWLRTAITILITAIIGFGSTTLASADPPSTLDGKWFGSVTWPNGTYPAMVQVTQSSPLRATIDIAGICAADWTEKSRTRDGILVHANVSYSSSTCVSGDWALTVTDSTMAGPSPDSPGNFISLRRDSDAESTTCADQRAAAMDSIPPAGDAVAALLLNRLAGLPQWVSGTLLIAACIPEAIDANPDGGVPNLWQNLNSQEFFTAVCRTAETIFDPLNLGYTDNFFCGTTAR